MAVLELQSRVMQQLDVARMRRIREDLGITQTQAAERAGMPLGRWNDIESGRKPNVTLETLAVVAGALECDARDLITPAKKGRKG